MGLYRLRSAPRCDGQWANKKQWKSSIKDGAERLLSLKIDEEKNDVFAIGIMSLEMLGKKIKGLNNN